MSPKRRIMGHKRAGEPVNLPDHVRRLVLKSSHGPLDTDEREVLAGWDQAHECAKLRTLKKRERRGTPCRT